jgi:hypothetical protein
LIFVVHSVYVVPAQSSRVVTAVTHQPKSETRKVRREVSYQKVNI